MNERRKYYSERMGLPEEPLRLKDLQLVIKIIFEEYDNKNYFDGAFGYHCVDEGYVPGRNGVVLEDHIIRTFMGRDIYPLEDNYESFSIGTCFDLIEYFYDNIGVPVDPFYHKWNNCGMHVNRADYEAGKQEFREKINPYLSRCGKGFELMPNGEVYTKTPETLSTIIADPPISGDKENIDDKVQRAISKFLHHSSSNDEKEESIRILADVLEFVKVDVKEFMFRPDENRLFEIANQFGIRHHNIDQKTDFDKNIWLEWIFYSYLNSINTIVKIKKTQE